MRFRLPVALAALAATASITLLAHASATVSWVSGATAPANAVVGGFEPGRALVVCRAAHEKGVHPGKVVAGNCNFGYGGKEIVRAKYEVLVIDGYYHWVAGSNGSFPKDAVAGGSEPNRTLYVCRAAHEGGVHPGKLVEKNCNISYGGKEITKNTYEVLASPEY